MNMNMIVETGVGKNFNRINLDINNDISICIFLELSVFEEDFGKGDQYSRCNQNRRGAG